MTRLMNVRWKHWNLLMPGGSVGQAVAINIHLMQPANILNVLTSYYFVFPITIAMITGKLIRRVLMPTVL